MWTATIDHAAPVAYDDLDDAVNAVLDHYTSFAAA
jgi:hypothetical protein